MGGQGAWRADGQGHYLALAEGRAVVDFVAAGALAHGLPATVDAGLLQGHKSWSLPGDTGDLRVGARVPQGSDMCPIPSAAAVPSPVTSRVSSSIQQGLQSLTGRWSEQHVCVSLPPNSRNLICTTRRAPSVGTECPSIGSRCRPWTQAGWAKRPPYSPGLPHLGLKWTFCVLSF